MLTKTWRRLRSPAAWALVLIFGAPMLAEAQQSGLFPLAPIRRQRVPCAMEDPVYGLYRQEYFGYHPTCWRKFPAGWGCPSPEAPNAALAFQKQPQSKPPFDPSIIDQAGEPLGPVGPADMPPPRANPPRDRDNALPAIPEGASPFNLDRDKPANPGGGLNPIRPAPPAGNEPQSNRAPVTGPPALSELSKPVLPAPSAPSPAEVPGAPPVVANPDTAPLLALPDPSAPTDPNNGVPPVVPSPTGNYAPASAPSADETGFPTQAPRRQSFLGALLSGIGRKTQ